jgi:hypothetical protein
LQKTFVVHVPAMPIVYEVTKSGTADLATQTVTWTVNVDATQGGVPVDLEGYRFVDQLQQAGPYVPGSFEINGGNVPDQDLQLSGNTLEYEFPAGSPSPLKIAFKTEIPDSHYFASGEQTLRNQAQLRSPASDLVGTAQAEVKFTPQWIEKTGVSNENHHNTGQYDPTNRQITWTIIANHMEAPLNGVVIRDELPIGLTFSHAEWSEWNGTTWVPKGTFNAEPLDHEYVIGDINSKIMLEIVADVPDEAYTTGQTTYTNTAILSWTGYQGQGPGISSGGVPVTIGFNAITKSGTPHPSDRKVKWTVTVDTMEQVIPDLKVYDLLVYGNQDINLASVAGIPAGVDPYDLVPRYGQKYDGNFSSSPGLTITVHPVTDGGTPVADLVEVSGFDNLNPNTFSFDTLILDPDVFASNTTKTVLNTAMLFSDDKKLNQATASVDYTSSLLGKEMLRRTATGNPAAGVNDERTSHASEGFNYVDKSVIFRINVNADGIDLTGALDQQLQPLGGATLTDTLPAGWKFVEIVPGSDYLIFEGTKSGGTVQATDNTPDTVPEMTAVIDGGTATFTFPVLNKPYVILLKARPTTAEAEAMFSSNQSVTKMNTVQIRTAGWTGVTSSRNFTVNSEILDKDYTKVEDGVLRWTVEYRPYDIAQPADRLEDHLPLGLDLPLDANGDLLIPGNIEAYEMTLGAGGSYTVGSPVALEQGTHVFYDNAARVLSFVIPDSAKAYRFTYITYVTGDPGTISNEVRLLGGGQEQESTFDSYVVMNMDGFANLQKDGWVEIEKTDGAGVPLAGAEFAVLAQDGVTVIRKGVTGMDGKVRLKVIPEGSFILRETAAPAGYTLEDVDHTVQVTKDGLTVTTEVDGKTGAGSETLTVKNYLIGTAGNLTISKAVAGTGADPTRTFDFTVTLTGAPGVYDYVGHGVPGGQISSGGTVSLAHGQSITIVGLPKDAAYTVTEHDYADDGYVTTSTSATGTIAADETQTAAFTGERNKLGSIFMDFRNDGGFADRNTMLYGHNMKDGSMFHSLTKYRDQRHYDSHPAMLLHTPGGSYRIELFAGIVVDGDVESVRLAFRDDEDFLDYVAALRQSSTFVSDTAVGAGDRIITLCTCSYEFNNARYALFGKLVPLG